MAASSSGRVANIRSMSIEPPESQPLFHGIVKSMSTLQGESAGISMFPNHKHLASRSTGRAKKLRAGELTRSALKRSPVRPGVCKKKSLNCRFHSSSFDV